MLSPLWMKPLRTQEKPCLIKSHWHDAKKEARRVENKGFIIRSKAVFDSVRDDIYPAAVLVEGERIRKILPWDCKGYEEYPVKDYGDRLLMSAFIDAHTHVFSGAVSNSEAVCSTLGECHSQEECAQKIWIWAQNHPRQKRIRGEGWFVSNWDKPVFPDRKSLDRLILDRPVYLLCADSHSMWLNSAALKEAGIRPDPDLEGGVVQTDENGELTGLLLEPAAYAPAKEKYMEFSDEELYQIHRDFQKKAASLGICALSEMFADDYTEETYRRFGILKRLDQEEGLNTRVFAYTKCFGYTDFTPYFKLKDWMDSKHLALAGVKGFIDGVTESFTGMLLEPYANRPGFRGEGVPLYPEPVMQESITAANRAGIQVRLHCIADGSVRLALDMYEKAQKNTGIKDLRNTVEHIENIHPDDLERFRELDVLPSVQFWKREGDWLLEPIIRWWD